MPVATAASDLPDLQHERTFIVHLPHDHVLVVATGNAQCCEPRMVVVLLVVTGPVLDLVERIAELCVCRYDGVPG